MSANPRGQAEKLRAKGSAPTGHRTLICALSLVMLVTACSRNGTTTTSAAPPTTPVTLPTTTAGPSTTSTTATTSVPVPFNPWTTLLGEVSSPRGWTVVPCEGDEPLLCITHDGLTSQVELIETPLSASTFAGFLAAAGAPPETTDLGAAAAYPAILRALHAQVEADSNAYAATMRPLFPDGHEVFEYPVIAPMGSLTGLRYSLGIEGPDGSVLAWAVRHLAFDGEALWLITAEFNPRSDEAGFTDLTTLLDLDPHLTLIVRDLAIQPALPGTDVTAMALPAVGDVTSEWSLRFTIPYGPTVEALGTSPGGDAGSLLFGPEFGTQAFDGTWWMLDGPKKRLAHYSPDGDFLDQVTLGPGFLVDGEFFQWQLPHALSDGAIVASRLDPDHTYLLMLTDTALATEMIPMALTPKIDDGDALYGLARDGSTWRIDPASGTAEMVDWFQTRAGTRFQLRVSAGTVTVWLPDAQPPNIHRFEFHGSDPTDSVWIGLEAATGTDGSIYLYLLGGSDSGPSEQLGGFLTIAPDGTVEPLEPTRGPQIRSDPGSPAHLGSNPTTGLPWLMFVDEDGVRVFEQH